MVILPQLVTSLIIGIYEKKSQHMLRCVHFVVQIMILKKKKFFIIRIFDPIASSLDNNFGTRSCFSTKNIICSKKTNKKLHQFS